MKKKRLSFYIILIIINIIIFPSIITAKEKKQSEYDKVKKTDNIVFLGDSITDWYPIEEIYGDLPIVRSGIAGYETEDIISKLETMVYRYNPTKIFILIGTNDLKRDEDATEKTANNMKKIINEIHKKRKNAKIYLQSIYPVNRNLWAPEERYNSEITEVNNIMKEYCKENNVTYIDMYNELADENGNFDEKYTDDGLHPNDLGYARISLVLSEYIYGVK